MHRAPHLGLRELETLAGLGSAHELGPVVVLSDTSGSADERSLPVDLPLIVIAPEGTGTSDDADLIADGELGELLTDAVLANPQAAVALAQLLRVGERLDVRSALMLESFAYSMLQAGPEFAGWLAKRKPSQAAPDKYPLRVDEQPDRVVVTLDRPRWANALDGGLRAELFAVFSGLRYSDALVELRGAGEHFCSGGDLREFGLASDPVTAHGHRTSQLLPAAVAEVAPRLVVHVHGVCVGAGAELSAFASRVVAAPDTRWLLPEVAMGLIPGCGGTVSIPRRVGRHRALRLALDSRGIGVETALEWGLADAVEP